MARMMRIDGHYYRGYPADFSAGRAPARTFLGWDKAPSELDLDRSALVLMHLPDAGLRPEVAWSPNCPRPDLLGSREWVPRTMDLVTHRLPPLVVAARQARLQIVHVTMGGWYARNYPQRQRCAAEVGQPPPPQLEPLPQEPEGDWHTARSQRNYRPSPRPPGSPDAEETEFVPGLEPRDNDLVCSRTWELHRLLCARGIRSLIYTGWALNWCLWFSECGMNDMQNLRYRLYAVRGGCVAIENAESADTEGNLQYAYWMTSAKFGDLFDLADLTAALRAAPAADK